MSGDNQPIFHHYIPRFYLRRWADNERKVCRFSKPYDRIVPKMVSTRGTGGEDGLYALKSVAPEHAQWFEQGAMKAIDTAANHVLDLLEAGKLDALTNTHRSAWARFLMSLLMRGPRDMEVIKAEYAQEWQKLIPDIVADFQGSENNIDTGARQKHSRTDGSKLADARGLGAGNGD
jgi:hypothetical protein